MQAPPPPEVALPPPPGVQYLPGEDVLLLAVTLPAMAAAQRRAAVAYAVEDRIAAALDEVHVVLGPAMGAGWLVAVVARDVLARTPPTPGARLMPDTLALPVPQAGQWSVWTDGVRALVRTADGAGFAAPAAALPVYHRAADGPQIVLYGAAPGLLDAGLGAVTAAPLPARAEAGLDRFDLNTARATGRGLNLSRNAARLAAVLAVAALGHLALLAADIWALSRISAAHQATLRAALDAIGQPAQGDLDAALARTLAQADGAGRPRLIATLGRTFAALAPQAGRVTLSDLRFGAGAGGGGLTLTLQAPDIVTLQDAEVALTQAGFRVVAGAATTVGGLAEQQLALQGGEGGA